MTPVSRAEDGRPHRTRRCRKNTVYVCVLGWSMFLQRRSRSQDPPGSCAHSCLVCLEEPRMLRNEEYHGRGRAA